MIVMAGLVPAMQLFPHRARNCFKKARMPGIKPGMTF